MERVIGELGGNLPGPLVILVGGVHCNEDKGVEALQHVISGFEGKKIHGKVVALRGNLKALKAKKRFLTRDLIRSWSTNLSNEIIGEEVEERDELKRIIENELKEDYTKAYLIDLHTTSAPTVPFLMTNEDKDTLDFVHQLELPFVSGISGYLDGTLLNWMCKKGHVRLAFEAGSHHSKTSLIKHESFVTLSFHILDIYRDFKEEELVGLRDLLSDELAPKHFHFTLVERYKIDENDKFKMEEGFSNFEKIYKGEVLAKNQYGDIMSAVNGNIFMPLYQDQGKDGFFIIKPEKS